MNERWRSFSRLAGFLGLGLLVGAAVGLLIGWVVWPIEFTEADPTVLEDGYQRDYTLMIATAYAGDGDLDLAQRRLRSLGKVDSEAWLLTVTVDHILQARAEPEIRFLVDLADDLGLYSPIMDPYLPAPNDGAGG